jgi:hypothetical protein
MRDRRFRIFLIAGVVVALVHAGVVSYYASSSPDGLVKVADVKGFLDNADGHATDDSPLADYGVEGVDNDRVSTGLAGVAGVAITLVIAGGLFLGLRRFRRPSSSSEDDRPSVDAGAGERRSGP